MFVDILRVTLGYDMIMPVHWNDAVSLAWCYEYTESVLAYYRLSYTVPM